MGTKKKIKKKRNNIFSDIKNLILSGSNQIITFPEPLQNSILLFLDSPSYQSASDLYDLISERHNKQMTFTFMNDVKLYEDVFKKILPDLRDHYLHSASVYVLGLAIYNNISPIRHSINRLLSDDDNENISEDMIESFLFRWALSACLHDIGYPLELTLKSFNKYSKGLHNLLDKNYSFVSIKKDIYENYDIIPILSPTQKSNIIKKDTALGLIASHLINFNIDKARISFETLLELIKKYLDENLEKGRIDHGVFSALIVLNRIHELYEKEQYNSGVFYGEVVDSAAAIFLHNVYRYSNLKKYFGNGLYLFDYPSPLGFLLFLSDTFCEFMRGDIADQDLFRFEIIDEVIYLTVPNNLKDKIIQQLEIVDKRITIKINTDTLFKN